MRNGALNRVDRLTPELVEAFAGLYLSPIYDAVAPTPQFHRECWTLYCSDTGLAAVAAPRGHAKSTALTHNYGLAAACFRAEDYIIVVSSTETLAIEHLGDIAAEFRSNEDLIRDFKIKGLSTDAKTDIVVDFEDGHQCRFVAKGSGQKMRGMKWRGKRPGLILCDDLEDDEQVENKDRRTKFRRWFYRALIPCLKPTGKIRFHGTIIHEDSALNRIMRGKRWKTLFFKAHAGFDDFSDILWPERFNEAWLRDKRQEYIDDQDPGGYSQEYLNDPFDNEDAYLRKDDFLPMRHARGKDDQDDYLEPKTIVAGADFAVSKADKANRTSFTIAGVDAAQTTHFVDQFVGRWDTREWLELLFDIQVKWKPSVFFVEDGVIWKSVSPFIYKEMLRRPRGEWINFQPLLPVKDKATRGRDYQKAHRMGKCRYDKDAEWYEGFEHEQLRFTGMSEASLDDQFDSAATLMKGLNQMGDIEEEDFEDEEDREMRHNDPRRASGRNKVTGY
jgi:hypothetical protein